MLTVLIMFLTVMVSPNYYEYCMRKMEGNGKKEEIYVRSSQSA